MIHTKIMVHDIARVGLKDFSLFHLDQKGVLHQSMLE